MQDLWQTDTHWDESVSPDICTRWKNLRAQFPLINEYVIPRCVKYSAGIQGMQVHGFCDASQKAYGACLYVRTHVGDNEFRAELLCAKSRVPPIKSTSLPRLELAAALLLSQLIEKISNAIDLVGVQVFL